MHSAGNVSRAMDATEYSRMCVFPANGKIMQECSEIAFDVKVKGPTSERNHPSHETKSLPGRGGVGFF